MRLEGDMSPTRFLGFETMRLKGSKSATHFLGFETMRLEGSMPSTRFLRFRNHAHGGGHAADTFSEVSKPYS